jgi:hypothetical protein
MIRLRLLARLALIAIAIVFVACPGTIFDSLTNFGQVIADAIDHAYVRREVFFCVWLPANVRRVSLALFIVAIEKLAITLGLNVEQLASVPRIRRLVIEYSIGFVIANRFANFLGSGFGV